MKFYVNELIHPIKRYHHVSDKNNGFVIDALARISNSLIPLLLFGKWTVYLA